MAWASRNAAPKCPLPSTFNSGGGGGGGEEGGGEGIPCPGDSNLSSHPTDRGVRAYARRLSVSPAAVRKGVAEGRIPIGAEGRILPDAADAALARGVVSGPTVSRTLAEARRRKLAASVRLLDDELAELRANSVTPADLKRDWLEACRLVAAEVERTFGVNVPRTEGDAQTGFPCCTR